MASVSDLETFGDSCITSYKVFPPDEWNLHKRKFKVYSKSGKKYIVTVDQCPSCTCPDHCFRHKVCKHIDFIMNNVLLNKFTREHYNHRTLDGLFKRLPGYIIHDC